MARAEIEAGRAFIRLFMKDETVAGFAKFGKTLQKIGTGITAVGTTLAAASGAVIAFGANAVSQFSDVGDAVDKMAARTGLSTEAVSELGHAAGLSGTDIETLETGIKKMQDTLASAAKGAKPAVAALDSLGLSVETLLSLSPDKQFEAFAEAISKIESPSTRTAIAMDVFGKAGTQLLPMMADGAKGIAEMREQARSLGLSMDRETTSAAAALNDALGTLKSSISGIVTQIGAALAPAVTDIANRIFPVVGAISNFIRQNRQLVVAIAGVTMAIAAAGAVLISLGVATITVGTALTALGAIADVVFSPILLIVGAVAAGVAALTIFVYQATDGFATLKAPLAEVVSLMSGLGNVMAQGGIRGLGEVLKKAGDVLLSFISDVFDQLPTLVGYALGRLARQVLDHQVGLWHNVGKIAVAIFKGIVQGFKDMIKAMMRGDIEGAVVALTGSLGKALQAGMQASGGFGTGFMKGDIPFDASNRTGEAWKAMTGGMTGQAPVGAPMSGPRSGVAVSNPFQQSHRGATMPWGAPAMAGVGAGGGGMQIQQQQLEMLRRIESQLAQQKFKYGRQ